MKLTLDLDKNAGQADRVHARAVLDLDAPQLKGTAIITAEPAVAAIHGIDLDALGRSEFGIETKLSFRSRAAPCWRCLVSIDLIAAGEGPAQFEGTATGAWGAPLRLKAKISGAGLDADAHGSAEPWAPEAKANVNLNVRSADLGPLLDLKPADTLAQNISLSSRVTLAGNSLTFDDLDSSIAGSRLRGRLAVTLDQEKDDRGRNRRSTSCDWRRRLRWRIGAAGHDAAEPLGAGLMKGWRGRIAFQALRGMLPGGSELQPGERHRQERRPVADLRCHQGQDRRRRGDREHRRAGRARTELR